MKSRNYIFVFKVKFNLATRLVKVKIDMTVIDDNWENTYTDAFTLAIACVKRYVGHITRIELAEVIPLEDVKALL